MDNVGNMLEVAQKKDKKLHSNQIEIEDYKSGKLRRILVYNQKKVTLPQINLEAIQRSDDHFFFCLSLNNYEDDGNKQVTYIFFKKRTTLILELIKDSLNAEKKSFNRMNFLLNESHDVQVLVPGKKFLTKKVSELSEYSSYEETSQL